MPKHYKGSDASSNVFMWVVGILLGVLSLATAFTAIRVAQIPQPLSRDDMLRETRRYDPLFRSILLEKAFLILDDIHITEYHSELDLQRNVREIEESLNSVSAFESANFGLLRIFDVLHAISDVRDEATVLQFMNMKDAEIQRLSTTMREAAYIQVFQGLFFLKKYRESIADDTRLVYLRNARERLESAMRISREVPNMFNGLGIVIVDEMHERGYDDRAAVNELLQSASQYFEIGFLLNPSRRNYAAQVSNLATITMEREFWRTFEILTSEMDEFIGIAVITDDLESQLNRFYSVLREYEKATVQNGQAPTIQVSIAECYAIIGLLSAYNGTNDQGIARFSGDPVYFGDALKAVTEAYAAGFKDWPYLISRPWILAAMTVNDEFRNQIIEYARH